MIKIQNRLFSTNWILFGIIIISLFLFLICCFSDQQHAHKCRKIKSNKYCAHVIISKWDLFHYLVRIWCHLSSFSTLLKSIWIFNDALKKCVADECCMNIVLSSYSIYEEILVNDVILYLFINFGILRPK